MTTPGPNYKIFIHPSAIIEHKVTFGEDCKVWHFCHIMSGARIGNNVTIGQNCFIAGSVIIGDNCHIQNNVSLYDGVILGDDVFIGPSAVFTNVINPRVGFPRRDEYRVTDVRKGASIGANSTILCGITLGKYCFVGAGSVVTRSVNEFSLVYGNPARERGVVCICGTAVHNYCMPCPSCGRRLFGKEPECESPESEE